MQHIYATAAEYYDFIGEDYPGTADSALNAQLRSASEEITTMTRTSRYDVDDTGAPTDPNVIDAFMRATCAVVQYWSITLDETGADGNSGAVKIGSVSLGTTLARQPVGDKQADRIGVKAGQILRNEPRIFNKIGY